MRPHIIAGCLWLALTNSPAAGSEPPAVQLTALHSMERIRQHEAPFGRETVEIAAARNEVESFQVVVAAPQNHLRVTAVEITDFTGPDGRQIGREQATLYRQEYVRVRMPTPRAELPPGLYPDPLVPLINPITGEPIEPRTQRRERWGEPLVTSGYDMYGVPFEVFAGQNQPLWVDVRVPADAVAGQYQAVVRVRAAGQPVAEIPVSLTVWDFTLPELPTHRTHFGSFGNIVRWFDVPRGSAEFQEIELRYCQALADHRITPPIPRHLLPAVQADGSLQITPDQHAALTQYLADLRVADFQIPRAPFARLPHSTTGPDYKKIDPEEREKAIRYYRDYDQYLKENGWDQRAYIYLWDEPNLPENYEQVRVLGELVREASPDLKRLVVEQTYPHDPDWPDMDPAVDIWCPLWAFINRETLQEKLDQGDEVWSYTALVQRAPRYHPRYDEVRDQDPPYWHIDRPLLVYRIPTWINHQYGITGLLYWSTVTTVIDPWFNPAFSHPRHYNGGGFLLYPGTPCGIDGPVASMRLKNLRDGLEDYEYLVLLEERVGVEAARAAVDQIAPNWRGFSRDPEEILAVRREIARQIEAAADSP